MNIFQRALNRVSEPSTWAGVSGLSILAGLPPGTLDMTTTIIGGIAGLFAIFNPDSATDRAGRAPAEPETLPQGLMQSSPFVLGPTAPRPKAPQPGFYIWPNKIDPASKAPLPEPAPVPYDPRDYEAGGRPFVIGGTAPLIERRAPQPGFYVRRPVKKKAATK